MKMPSSRASAVAAVDQLADADGVVADGEAAADADLTADRDGDRHRADHDRAEVPRQPAEASIVPASQRMSTASRPTSRPKIWLASSRNGKLRPGTPNVVGRPSLVVARRRQVAADPPAMSLTKPQPPVGDVADERAAVLRRRRLRRRSVFDREGAAARGWKSDRAKPPRRSPRPSCRLSFGSSSLTISAIVPTNPMIDRIALTMPRSAPVAASSSEIIVTGGSPTSAARSETTGIGALMTSMIGLNGEMTSLIPSITGLRNFGQVRTDVEVEVAEAELRFLEPALADAAAEKWSVPRTDGRSVPAPGDAGAQREIDAQRPADVWHRRRHRRWVSSLNVMTSVARRRAAESGRALPLPDRCALVVWLGVDRLDVEEAEPGLEAAPGSSAGVSGSSVAQSSGPLLVRGRMPVHSAFGVARRTRRRPSARPRAERGTGRRCGTGRCRRRGSTRRPQ